MSKEIDKSDVTTLLGTIVSVINDYIKRLTLQDTEDLKDSGNI